MRVVGGTYVERCASPRRIELLGSGGRAARALADRPGVVTLDTFAASEAQPDLRAIFGPTGVDLRVHRAPSAVEFHYLHELARPRLQPMEVSWAGIVDVRGEIVLRYGCIEGSFRCVADTAVFDPQSSRPEPFHANGSHARRAALVANRREFEALTGAPFDPETVAAYARHEAFDVVVVKSGPAGAWVVEPGHPIERVPAYRSGGVAKIGSGDVFGAAFARSWAERGLRAADAADMASRHVADYVSDRRLPLAAAPAATDPIRAGDGTVTAVIVAAGSGMVADWLVAEAVTALDDVGVVAVSVLSTPSYDLRRMVARADLLVALTVEDAGWCADACALAVGMGRPALGLVATSEGGAARRLADAGATVLTDLATLAYEATWSAVAHE